MSSWKRHVWQALMTAGVLLVLLVATTPLSPVADAAFEGCRSDPIVHLSDGSTLIVTVDIGADASEVTALAYWVHAPQGVTMLSVEHQELPGFSGKVRFVFIDDLLPNQFMTDTVVQLDSLKGVPVAATTTRNRLTSTASGVNGEHLRSTLSF